ncbi:MAG TPA: GAF domain-containing protein [Candidatus Limnocylindrales bacterium]|nr:GAF domain-containing protein [Candidatus Limnocylindrales bacterium]
MPTKSSLPSPASRAPRPGDATLSVTKAARVLGVHPNTVRAWSDAGRLRYYRINDRGDRRYRIHDLHRFLAAAESGSIAQPADGPPGTRAGARREPGPPGVATLSESPAGLELLADLAEVASFPSGLDPALDEACRRIRLATGAALVGIWERRPGGLVPRATDVEGPGITAARAGIPSRSLFTLALESEAPIHARPGAAGPAPVLGMGTDELVVRIPGGEQPWGILVLAGAMQLGPDDGVRLAHAIARTLGVLIRGASASEQATGRLRRSEALRRVATDLASRLDVGDVVRDLSDHARVLFGADRVAVVLRDAEGRVSSPGGTGFSEAFLAVARELEEARAGAPDIPARRPVLLLGPEAPRSGSPLRAAAVQEGVDTLLVAPLVDGHELHGVLYLAHDRPHRWREVDLDGAEALAGDAAIAVRSARTFGRMAAWAAQLQSIQRLGARLSGLTDIAAIGHAIAVELRQLIDYENARVYRVRDSTLVPVAMQGSGGVYGDETVESLTVEVGEGITGWVARFRVPQLVDDTAKDPRAITIPGTEEDLDESMLLAPMVHEGSCLGVVVLSRLGLRQFTEDDLRLLVIYASFAAQAMANGDATEQLRRQSSALERQLAAQQALLKTTESILTTLDQRQLLEQITDRLGSLIQCDNIAIEVVERPSGLLRPLTARGIHADEYMAPWEPGETGIATWVVEHNEPVLIDDEASDERVNHFRATGRLEGSLIVVPLLGPHGAAGVLTLERMGQEQPFDEQEFDLVKLFAAQVSIALRNAEIYHEAELRAKTDDLTTLLNHGTFKDRLARSVSASDPFGLVMIDLDDFKTVNDRLGHQAGDRLLREIAAAILNAARETDAVFRYGGDEFVVILPRTDTTGLGAAADRILAAVSAVGGPGSRWRADGVSIGASIGTAYFPDDGETPEDVLLAADRACFVAKRRGRGQVATAQEGRVLASEFELSEPTPVDPPTIEEPVAG